MLNSRSRDVLPPFRRHDTEGSFPVACEASILLCNIVEGSFAAKQHGSFVVQADFVAGSTETLNCCGLPEPRACCTVCK